MNDSTDNNKESGPSENKSPPWGILPSEFYLLEHYDPESSLSLNNQAKCLANAYIRSGVKRMNKPSQPPILTLQKLAFLKAWRPLSIRRLATEPGMLGNIWVRTYYSSETDTRHEALISEIDVGKAVDREERVFNDASLYGDFGENWQDLFELLPELIVNAKIGPWKDYQAWVADVGILTLEEMAKMFGIPPKGTNEGGIAEHLVRMMVEVYMPLLAEDNMQPEVLELLDSVHESCVVAYIIVEDQVSLEDDEGLLLLAFVDAWGRVVKSKRVSNRSAEQMGGTWLNGNFARTSEWKTGQVGEAYREGRGWEDLVLGREGK